jgi:hypothetical protein
MLFADPRITHGIGGQPGENGEGGEFICKLMEVVEIKLTMF